MRSDSGSTCSHCGAPVTYGRCAYCGSHHVDEADLIAKPVFGRELGGWWVPKTLPEGFAVQRSQEASSLSVSLNTKQGLGAAAAWVPSQFVDVRAEVSVRFATSPCDTAAGIWMRVRDKAAEALTVSLWDNGALTAARRHRRSDGSVAVDNLATVRELHDCSRSVRLGVSVKEQLLVVEVEGRPVCSVPAGPVSSGTVDLRLQVGREPAVVVLEHPVMRLP